MIDGIIEDDYWIHDGLWVTFDEDFGLDLEIHVRDIEYPHERFPDEFTVHATVIMNIDADGELSFIRFADY